jgi:glycosyltransferase involved in cell wall biosynthesis
MNDRAVPSGGALLCFSHLRWDFVYQRPQHLMVRLANHWPVLFIEEPMPFDGVPHLEQRIVAPGVEVIVPRLEAVHCVPAHAAGEARRRVLLDALLRERGIHRPVLWYYTPMSWPFSRHLSASLVVYDCMDQLSAFHGAPPQLVAREADLMASADLVFTGGYSLYEAKRFAHSRVFPFPSSVDVPHFAQARRIADDPPELAGIGGPRIGFYGVIDERFDTGLVAQAAAARTGWQWLFVGPVAKISPASLPQAPNIHWIDAQPYAALPAHVGRWDVAMMPFALNEATRFISPTKTPEYLAAGCPVVSTPIRDVERHWGHSGLVRIAADAAEFVDAIEYMLAEWPARSPAVCLAADALLHGLSWDRTCSEMTQRMRERLAERDSKRRRDTTSLGGAAWAA